MANIKLDRGVVQEAIVNIEKYAHSLEDVLKEIANLTISINEVYQTTGTQTSNIESLRDTIDKIKNNYVTCLFDYLKALGEIMVSYELEDSRAAINVSQNGDRAIATMTVGAGAFSSLASGFDFSKISGTASDVANGNFISKSKVYDNAFADGNYTFEYREDGVVRIDKDGVPMAFTTKENADKITGGIQSSDSYEQVDDVKDIVEQGDQTAGKYPYVADLKKEYYKEDGDYKSPTTDGSLDYGADEKIVVGHKLDSEHADLYKKWLESGGEFKSKSNNFDVDQKVKEIQEATGKLQDFHKKSDLEIYAAEQLQNFQKVKEGVYPDFVDLDSIQDEFAKKD